MWYCLLKDGRFHQNTSLAKLVPACYHVGVIRFVSMAAHRRKKTTIGFLAIAFYFLSTGRCKSWHVLYFRLIAGAFYRLYSAQITTGSDGRELIKEKPGLFCRSFRI